MAAIEIRGAMSMVTSSSISLSTKNSRKCFNLPPNFFCRFSQIKKRSPRLRLLSGFDTHCPQGSTGFSACTKPALMHAARAFTYPYWPTKWAGARMSTVELEPSLAVKKKAVDIAAELKGTSVFLVGMNCTMKTNLGKLLADALRYYYFDSDNLVEEAVGTVPGGESFRQRDEKGFRESETEVLKQLSSMGRLVICAGDGSVQSSTNLAFLRYGISLWVDIPLEVIANEMAKTEVPAVVGQNLSSLDTFQEVLEKLVQRYQEMREGYGTADATVSQQKVASRLGYKSFESVTPEDMAMETLKEIERLTRSKKMMEDAGKPF